MEDQATNTLYHGLVHSTVEDINTPLGLPQLPYSQDNTPLLPRGVSGWLLVCIVLVQTKCEIIILYIHLCEHFWWPM